MGKNRHYYLREWRDRRDLTQEQLADLAGVTQGTISSIEVNPTAPRKRVVLQKLCRALQIEAAQLETNPEAPTEPPRKDPRDMTPDELWEGFDALYMGGELSEKDIIDRLVLLRIEMEKRGIK